jgi:hypothetical protein
LSFPPFFSPLGRANLPRARRDRLKGETENEVTSTAPWVLLFGVAMYSAALIGLIILVLAFVRMSRAVSRISQSLEEISTAMRSDPNLRQLTNSDHSV